MANRIKNKMFPGFPDWKCQNCPQAFEGECRAYLKAKSQIEFQLRRTGVTSCSPNDVSTEVCPPYTVRMSMEDLMSSKVELTDPRTVEEQPPAL